MQHRRIRPLPAPFTRHIARLGNFGSLARSSRLGPLASVLLLRCSHLVRSPRGPMSNNHKRKHKRPTLVVTGTATQESYRSYDDRRQRTRLGAVQGTATPSTSQSASFWDHEDLATNAARMDPEFTYQLGDTSLSCEPDLELDDGIQVVLPPAVKKPNTVRQVSKFVCVKISLMITCRSVH
jgi:hypothetical protein